MTKTLYQAFFKHSYLLIAALWLYTFSFIFENYIAFTSRPQKVISIIEADINQKREDFFSAINDKKDFEQLVADTAFEIKQKLIEKDYGIYFYKLSAQTEPELIYWNNFKVLPSLPYINNGSTDTLIKATNGYYYLVRTNKALGNKVYAAIALIPVKYDFAISTKYLQNDFAINKSINDYYNISFKETPYPVKNIKGKNIFYLDQLKKPSSTKPTIISLVFRIVSVLALMLFLHSLAIELLVKEGFRKSFLFLLANIVILRYLSYRFSFLFDFKGYVLFDSEIYSSGFLHPSLGDLLINVLLSFWLVIFIRLAVTRTNFELSSLSKYGKGIAAFIAIALLLAFSFQAAGIIQSLVVDSKISFDVTNFFTLSVYTFISFVVIALLMVTFYHFANIILASLKILIPPTILRLLAITVAGFGYLSFHLGHAETGSRIFVVLWVLLYALLVIREKDQLYKTITKSPLYLFWIIFFAASATALMLNENRIKEKQIRIKFAKELTSQGNSKEENLIALATKGMDDSFFAKSMDRWMNKSQNRELKDSIINESFAGYLNKFNSQVFTFDKYFKPLYNDENIGYASLMNFVNRHKQLTAVKNLFYFNPSPDKHGFFFEKPMYVNDSLYGYFFIVVRPRPYTNEALYPELFKENYYDIHTDFSNYSYAVYKNHQLISNVNNFSFPAILSKNELPKYNQILWRIKDGYEQLIYKAPNDKIVMIVKSHSLFIETLTLFAYVFLTFLMITLLFQMGSVLLKSRFSFTSIKPLLRFNIRTQVQATIVFISVFSFVVIGIATISFFIIRFKNSNEEMLGKTIDLLRNEIELNFVRQQHSGQNPDSLFSNEMLESIIGEISQIHNADVNVYNLSGKLTSSTQPYLFNRHILANCMHPEAFFQLHFNKRVQWIQQESFNNFNYLSMYVPIRDGDGNWRAYLNVPFLNSQTELKQEISNFLVTLINLNAFIFLLAAAIAVMLTNRITQSLSLIAGKMKEVSLTKQNQTIEWNHDDEIGALVMEYNRMVYELERSAKNLVKTEREEAWREMAKQVAHEIKNPLTPMKLSIQYLQRAIDSNAGNVKELSQKVAATMVQQIDQLARIASDFSQFANINTINREKFDITEVIEQVILLHHTGNEVVIHQHKQPGDYSIHADKNQINRLFTNLIKNAIEAVGKEKAVLITINQRIEKDNVIVSVHDNGNGIPEEMQKKIFIPNFTTKSSGTGLGLAMCKGIVENAGGKIWFTTEQNKGTAFFVSIPLAK